MTPMLSLRARILLGAFLWTIGLFTVTGLILTQVLFRHPTAPAVFHHVFEHVVTLSAVAVAAMVFGLSQVKNGLSAVEQLRIHLAAVHAGHDRLEGRYPAEVQPLVDDLNVLLEHRAQMVRRALAKAGDLAHGLKTPLAVLSHEAERAEAAGHAELAATIGQQVERMRRQIEYHLAHARAAASGATPGARCSIKESVDGLARTLQRLHAERGITIEVEVEPDHSVRGQREDLDEMLGNLLDNGCKWARTRVIVRSSIQGSRAVIVVEDDGPGLDPSMHGRVLQRGVRADEAAPGSGFGLAIVRDLAEVYGGSIALDRSPEGGLRARLDLPT